MFHQFNDIGIKALLGVSSSKTFSLDELCKPYADERTIARLKSSIGFKTLRILDKDKTVVDMATVGINHLITNNIFNVQDIDGVVFVTESPNHLVPAPSYMLQKNVGFKKDVLLVDMIGGCSGFVNGLMQTYLLVQAKLCKKVLLVCGETKQTVDDTTEQKLNLSIFSDGLGIALIEEMPCGVSSFNIYNDGDLHKVIMYENMPGGAYRYKRVPKADHFGMFIEGTELANYILDPCVDRTLELLQKANISNENISKVICHQANKVLVKLFAQRVNFTEEQAPFLAENTGNTGSATIPVALSECFAHKSLDKKVVFIGFGVGLSYASCVLSLKDTAILDALYI